MHLPGKSTEVRNVMRSEDITEPKDVIPTGRMARVIARRQWESGRVRTCSIMFSYDMRLYSTPFYYCTFILLYYITTKVHYIYIQFHCEACSPFGNPSSLSTRILQEIGTDGQHVADAEPTRLEQDIYGVVEGAVGGKGALVGWPSYGHLLEKLREN